MLERLVGPSDPRLKTESQLCKVVSSCRIPWRTQDTCTGLAANYNEIKLNLASYMASMGIELMSLTIANISLPDEVNAAIDKRGAVGALGSVLNQYSQMQAADALKAAAENQGGTGTMMGMMMGGQLGAFGSQQAFQQQQPAPPPPPVAPMFYIAVNGQQQGPYQVAQLQAMIASGAFTQATLVWTTGMAAWQAANTVPALAALFAPPPPPPPPAP